MAATAEWAEIPFVLESVWGDLDLNLSVGDQYRLLPDGCFMGADLRIERDNIPQADGEIFHRRFEQGQECRLTMELWVGNESDAKPACGADLVRMMDNLNRWCRALLNAGDDEGRLRWTPTGEVTRMLDDIRLLDKVVVQAPADGRGTIVTFAVDTARPYAQDYAQTVTTLGATVDNVGSAPYWPVFKISGGGPFNLTNVTYGYDIQFTEPIGAGYIEIDTFRNTMYQNGAGANRLPGLDIRNSDFWAINPGSNVITLSGASGTMLWAPAWS